MSGNTESHGDQLMTETHLAYPAIRCRGATRVYRLPGGEKRVAVADLDLEVPAGGVFGFLGANGAGKTTTIKMLLGFLKPTSGRWRSSESRAASRRRGGTWAICPSSRISIPSFLRGRCSACTRT